MQSLASHNSPRTVKFADVVSPAGYNEFYRSLTSVHGGATFSELAEVADFDVSQVFLKSSQLPENAPESLVQKT